MRKEVEEKIELSGGDPKIPLIVFVKNMKPSDILAKLKSDKNAPTA